MGFEYHSSKINTFNCSIELGFLLLTLGLRIAQRSSIGEARSGELGGF